MNFQVEAAVVLRGSGERWCIGCRVPFSADASIFQSPYRYRLEVEIKNYWSVFTSTCKKIYLGGYTKPLEMLLELRSRMSDDKNKNELVGKV